MLDHRSAIESAAGVDSFDVFEPVAQRTQVVSSHEHNELTDSSHATSARFFLVLIAVVAPVSVCQVSGMNYFVKIRIGSDAYAHATIWRKSDQSVHVTKVETGKTQTDPL